MKPGQGSQTAVLVCMARAAAHGRASDARFSDPTALALLPDDARARVERYRAGVPATGAREKVERVLLAKRAAMMVARTVEIDEAVRAAAARQVVILGAGLDGRAWRMPELRDAIVFEVDHPDSQREKRARVGVLTQTAAEVRFVPVDFTRDRLDAALAAAGHAADQPTTWIWEGVVMYLTRAEVEATLAVVASRSARGSHLIVLYAAPALLFHLVGLIVKRLGEPFRSSYQPPELRALLAQHDFAVTRDLRLMKHLRLAVAGRR